MSSTLQHAVPRFFRYIFLLSVAMLAFTVYYAPCVQWYHQPSGHRDILMLIWLWPFNQPLDLLPDLCKSRFRISGCSLTSDRDLYDKADAVVIHHREIAMDLSNLPSTRRPHGQKWIWMNYESPSHSVQILGLDNLFNISLSYLRDADINLPYGRLVARETTENNQVLLEEKDKLVCWIISNYNPNHRRVFYYNELRKYVNVDVFGRHFNNMLSSEEYKSVVSSCKFYLSFENSLHNDYITEKLFLPLQLGTVPVVLGPSRRDYERLMPGHAFIHVEDFSSVQALARHMLHVANNNTLYQAYFRWRRHFEVKIYDFPEEHICYACDYVRRHREYQVLTDLYQRFLGG